MAHLRVESTTNIGVCTFDKIVFWAAMLICVIILLRIPRGSDRFKSTVDLGLFCHFKEVLYNDSEII